MKEPEDEFEEDQSVTCNFDSQDDPNKISANKATEHKPPLLRPFVTYQDVVDTMNHSTQHCRKTRTSAAPLPPPPICFHLPQSATETMKYHNATTPQRQAHRATNTFTFRGFGEKVRSLRVSSSKFLLRRPTTDDGEEATFLHQALLKARELNLTQAFQVGSGSLVEIVRSDLLFLYLNI